MGTDGQANVGQMSMQGPRIVLGLITRDSIHVDTALSILAASQANIGITSVQVHKHGPYLDDARNLLVQLCLDHAPPWDWLMMVDSDMVFAPADIATLIGAVASPHLTPVIGGVYANPDAKGRANPVVYRWGDFDRGDMLVPSFVQMSKKELADSQNWALVDGDVVGVGCVGTGFLAIHRSILVTLLDTYRPPFLPWFDEPIINGVHMGEDMGFCRRVLDLGYPVLVHRGVRLGHHKATYLTI